MLLPVGARASADKQSNERLTKSHDSWDHRQTILLCLFFAISSLCLLSLYTVTLQLKCDEIFSVNDIQLLDGAMIDDVDGIKN